MKKLLFLALFAGAALAGCDKIEDATSEDFPVEGVRFEFSADVEEGGGTRAVMAVQMNSFSVTRTVLLSELDIDDLIQYKDKVSKVVADSASIEITASPSGDYTVEDLVIEATGVTGSPVTIPLLATDGSTFTLTAAMRLFTARFVKKLIGDGSVEVTVFGSTDAPRGTTVDIAYESDLTFTASLL